MSTRAAIRLFVVDHSAIVRQSLQQLLRDDPEIVLMGSAPTPQLAVPVLRRTPPDVLLLDIDIPGGDVPAFLRLLRDEMPIPTVLCTSLGEERSPAALEALAAGGVALVARPCQGVRQFIEASRQELVQTVKRAARLRPRHADPPSGALATTASGRFPGQDRPVLIGASTGGTQAIEAVLRALPGDSPGIVIVQHMPEKFTAAFAQRLNSLCQIEVKEAQNNDRVSNSRALIAPGGKHMLLKRNGAQYHVEVIDGPLVNRHRPSVDVLFRSVAKCAGANALGVIMTGMGDDGAVGLLEMRQAGARTVAQDEASCVVYGMPKEAVKRGGVEKMVPLSAIAREIMLQLSGIMVR